MKICELKEKLRAGALGAYRALYSDLEKQTARMLAALDRFAERRTGATLV